MLLFFPARFLSAAGTPAALAGTLALHFRIALSGDPPPTLV